LVTAVGGLIEQVDERAQFAAFVDGVEPRLRRALVAAYGSETGREATADALAWAWQHWDRVQGMANPAGYLWRVGQTSARRGGQARSREVSSSVHLVDLESVEATRAPEPRLDAAMRALSDQQRAAVLLVHGYGLTLAETAEALGCGISTIRNHVDRALKRLRSALEVDDA
jgi:RNA polymerase sigma factor (sigma-70 family)